MHNNQQKDQPDAMIMAPFHDSIHLFILVHRVPPLLNWFSWGEGGWGGVRKSRISDCEPTNKRALCAKTPHNDSREPVFCRADPPPSPPKKVCVWGHVRQLSTKGIKPIMDQKKKNNNHSVSCSNSDRLQPSVGDWTLVHPQQVPGKKERAFQPWWGAAV